MSGFMGRPISTMDLSPLQAEIARLRAALATAERERDEAKRVANDERVEALRLERWLWEVAYIADTHHGDERPVDLLHALKVEIPEMCRRAVEGADLPQIIHQEVPVCSETGDVGCLDCSEGWCGGETNHAWAQFCRCGADDVYGEMDHADGCTLAAPEARTQDAGGET